MKTKKETISETIAEKEFRKLLDKLKKIEDEKQKQKEETSREEYLCK